MSASLRCKITGCDPDPCGVCRRCGGERATTHDWRQAERERPCFARQVCTKCEREREQPDHDWQAKPNGLQCSRCGMTI
ncbi:MAG TPA: hypothetical protein VD788_15695 [Candidatus Polarisedimenticolaceae bacterium]|nr:hypothetical protein [Candidatus Polarisedimenticolaceae bacterium]